MTMDDVAKWFDRRKQALMMNTCRADQPQYIRRAGCALGDGLEWIERVVFAHHNARVLCDTENRLSCLLDHATGGMLSKPGYDFNTMRIWVDDYISRNFTDNDDLEVEIEDAVDGALEPYTVLRPLENYTDAMGRVLWWVAPRGLNIGAPQACYVGTPHDDTFPQIGGLFYTTLPADVTVDDPNAIPHKMMLPDNLPEIAGRGLIEWSGRAAPAITRGAAEGFAGDADAPQ